MIRMDLSISSYLDFDIIDLVSERERERERERKREF